jgi:hypothetical protein
MHKARGCDHDRVRRCDLSATTSRSLRYKRSKRARGSVDDAPRNLCTVIRRCRCVNLRWRCRRGGCWRPRGCGRFRHRTCGRSYGSPSGRCLFLLMWIPQRPRLALAIVADHVLPLELASCAPRNDLIQAYSCIGPIGPAWVNAIARRARARIAAGRAGELHYRRKGRSSLAKWHRKSVLSVRLYRAMPSFQT